MKLLYEKPDLSFVKQGEDVLMTSGGIFKTSDPKSSDRIWLLPGELGGDE